MELIKRLLHQRNYSKIMLFAILIPCVLSTFLLSLVLLPMISKTAANTDSRYCEVLMAGVTDRMEAVWETSRGLLHELENDESLQPVVYSALAESTVPMDTKLSMVKSLALFVAKNPSLYQASFALYGNDNLLYTSTGAYEDLDVLRGLSPNKLCYYSFEADSREAGFTSVEFAGTEYLLYYTPFRDIPNGRNKGVLNLLFSADMIADSLFAASNRQAVGFSLMDDQDTILWSCNTSDVKEKTVTLQETISDGMYTLCMKIPRSISMKTQRLVIQTTILTLIVSMAFSILLSYFLSRLTYAPIQNVVKKFVGEEGPINNELVALERVFDRVLLEKGQSETILMRLRPLALQKLLSALLDGTAFLDDDSVQQLESCRVCFAYERYNVIALRVPFSVLQKENLPTELTMEVLLEHLSTHLSLSAYVLAEGSDDYRIIVNYDSWNTLQIYLSRIYSSCRDYFQKQEERLVFAGVGQAVFSPEELYQSADQAEMALNVAALNRLAQPMFYKELTDELSYDYYYPMSEELLLSRTVSNGNAENGKVIVQSIIQKNKEKMLMPNCLLMLYMDLSSTVARSGQGLGISTLPVETREIPKDLDSIQEKVEAMIDDICNQIASRHRKLANHTERRMMEFIEQHLFDPSLSVNQIADAFGKSVAYVSALFKEQYGTNYYNYVNKARIMRAIQLMNDEGLDHNTVYPMVGYTNISTFRRNLLKYTKNVTDDTMDQQE